MPRLRGAAIGKGDHGLVQIWARPGEAHGALILWLVSLVEASPATMVKKRKGKRQRKRKEKIEKIIENSKEIKNY